MFNTQVGNAGMSEWYLDSKQYVSIQSRALKICKMWFVLLKLAGPTLKAFELCTHNKPNTPTPL